MSVELTKKYADATDELFKAESRTALVTNSDYDWTGAHSIALWKISTVPLNDYKRNSTGVEPDATLSRYGALADLNATTEELILKKDRSFIFNVDKLDTDETAGQLEAGTALARECREVVIPEVDKYTYNVMATGAGTKATPSKLSKTDVYDKILEGSKALDDAEVPDTDRVLIVTPDTYKVIKQAVQFDNTEVGADMRKKGVVGILDGMAVVKVPASRLPLNFGFMIAHPCATTAPVKLDDYGVHTDTPLSSGSIVTGRICYDAFVLENKAKGIYLHNIA